MKSVNDINFLFENVKNLDGVGKNISAYLKNKKVEKVKDLLWNLPYSATDRSRSVSLDRLEVGKILTIKILVKKYNFPRIRNLPNRVNCIDETGKIDLIFFNSREGYIRKVLPINKWVVVSGKINFFKNKYQITNPEYISQIENLNYIQQVIPKYSLTEGINEKKYRKIIDQVFEKLPNIDEWHDVNFIKKMNFTTWKNSLTKIHQAENVKDLNSNFIRRLAYDEIFANLLLLSKSRYKIKKSKKKIKIFKGLLVRKLLRNLPFSLTADQKFVSLEIENDLKSSNRMFRIMQGDVGSGKTIVSFIGALNTIESGYQVALMAPTEILAHQHFRLAEKIFDGLGVNVSLITGKTEISKKKNTLNLLLKNKINFLIGTHSLFQKKIKFFNLGLVIIDEQHKFGVRQRIEFAKKGGDNCDVLLMSATPIPRTMMMSIYGDMDSSKIKEKPAKRKIIKTLSKPESKVNELWPFIKKRIEDGEQIFWVCPLIDESKKLDYTSAINKFSFMNKKFPNKVGLIHGSMSGEEKKIVIQKFLTKKISILVSTTVIEVGIDFPNATVIVIENANKFGLAQLHQLRGRVGRGEKQGFCILMFKGSLSKNARKRIQILRNSDDGFFIAEEDMKLRGFGDLIGFKQSGIKYFKLADPIHHSDLFQLAEENINLINEKKINDPKYNFLLRLFDKVDIIQDSF